MTDLNTISQCDHIVGYTRDIPYQCYILIRMSDKTFETTGDEIFNFCPICGQKLKYDPKVMFMVEDD